MELIPLIIQIKTTNNIVLTALGATYTVTKNGYSGTLTPSDAVSEVEIVRGSLLNDLMSGDSTTAIADSFFGENGDDTLSGGAGNDYLDGGNNTDTVSYAYTDFNTTINLQSETATVSVSSGSDTDTIKNFENVTGGNGNDTIILKAGIAGAKTLSANLIDGGTSGSDTVSYENYSANLTINLATAEDTATGDNDLFVSIENVKGGSGNDTITGSSFSNSINGLGGNDIINSSGGTDVIDGGAGGNDTITYGGETDKISLITSGDGLTYTITKVGQSSATDSATNIEEIIGTNYKDTFVGGLGADIFRGGNDKDILTGGAGIDKLYGELGDDTFVATSKDDGDDIIDGGDGVDTLNFTAIEAGNYVNVTLQDGNSKIFATGDTLTSLQTDTISRIENVIGTSGADIFRGNSENNTFDGGSSGSDSVIYDYSDQVITANLHTGTITGDGTDRIISIENITGGTNSDSFIMKDEAVANSITGGTNTTGNGDTVSYEAYTGGVKVNLATLTAQEVKSGDFDTLASVENLTGSNYVDTLIGDINKNTLKGGLQNDTLRGGAGNDYLDGGEGTDTADFSDATAGVSVDLSSLGVEQVIGGGLGSDTLVSIENLIGSSFDDTFYGNDTDGNSFDGGDEVAGNELTGDTVSYEKLTQASDKIVANLLTNSVAVTVLGLPKAPDTLVNIENIIGTKGDDTFINGTGVNTFTGGDGADTISYAGSGAVTIDLDGDSASVTGSTHTDKIFTIENVIGSSSDDLIKMDEADTINIIDGAGGTSDTISYENYTTTGVKVNLGNTLAQTVSGTTDVDTITNIENLIGTDLGDSLTGNSDGNIITGRSGSDTIFVSGGSDTIDGGAGDVDVANYGSGGAITLTTVVNAGANTYTVVKTNGTDTLTNIEVVQGSEVSDSLTGGSVADTFKAGAGNDILIGNGGADKLYGEAGDDIFKAIDGDTNADYLDGGSDNDTADYSAVSTKVIVTLGSDTTTSTVTINGSANDLITGIENITGGSSDDTLTGNELANTLIGGAGADTLVGNGGADSLDGGAGDDTFTGGAGADTLTGGADNDTFLFGTDVTHTTGDIIDGGTGTEDFIDYSTLTIADATGISVTLNNASNANVTVGATPNDHTIKGIENIDGTTKKDTIIGDNSDNTINGLAGDDILGGGAGADYLDGGDGNDTLSGGAGDDTLIGGAGIDTVDYSSETSENLVVDITDGSHTISSSQGTDTFSGIEGIIGGTKNDTLTGNSGANTLDGRDGDDTLLGKGGDDYLDGGVGTDFVSFAYTAQNVSVNLNSGSAQNTGDGNLTIKNVENLAGGAGNDILKGNVDGNILSGGYGSDTLFGNEGDDTLNGGLNQGYRISIGSFSAGTTYGFTINDEVLTVDSTGKTEAEVFEALTALFNNNPTANENGTLTIVNSVKSNGGLAEKALYITVQNNDTLTTTNMAQGTLQTFADTADYSSLNSSISVDLKDANGDGYQVDFTNSRDTLVDIEIIKGSQTADIFIGSDASDTFLGQGGNDTFTGNNGVDNLQGEAGNDTFIATSSSDGADIIDGGADSDTVDYSVLTSKIIATLDGTTQTTVTIGGSADDTIKNIENIIGGTNDDTFTGNSANNTFDGRSSTNGDIVSYNNVSDTGISIVIDLKNDTATGDGNDTLLNIENIIGGAGDDTIKMSTGTETNTIDGNNGTDTISYEYYTTAVTVDLRNDTTLQTVVANNFDLIKNIENIIGGTGNDSFKGNSANNAIDGGAGSDIVDYSDADSGIVADMFNTKTVTKAGGTVAIGTDTLTNIEKIIGTDYDDSFTSATDVKDTFVGGGNTTLGDTVDYSGVSLDDDFTNDKINVDLSAGSGYGTVNVSDNGSGQVDRLEGIENVIGTKGDDTFRGDSANNTFEGSDGKDTVSYSYITNTDGVVIDLANTSSDNVTVGSGTDIDRVLNIENIIGSKNNDIFKMSIAYATNIIDGASGTDTISYESYAGGVEVSLGITGTQMVSSGDIDTLSGIENLIGGTGNDKLTGSSTSNVIDGNEGSDTLYSSGGNDTLNGGVDSDGTIDHDIANYSSEVAAIKVVMSDTAGQNKVTKTNDSSVDTLLGIEEVVGTSSGDTFTGASGNDTFMGMSGDDTLSGGAGDDYLDGGNHTDKLLFTTANNITVDLVANTATGDGNDQIFNFENITTGTGNDTIKMQEDSVTNIIDGGVGTSDTISYEYYTDSVTVNLGVGTAQNVKVGDSDTILNIENIIGGAGGDILTGKNDSTVANTIQGKAGADTIYSSTGSDVIDGDTLGGANEVGVTDKVSYINETSGITLTTTGTSTAPIYTIVKSDGTDIVTNVEEIIGTTKGDSFTGDIAKDTFRAGAGNDVVRGGANDDSLYGEAGNDTFYATGLNDGADTIDGGIESDGGRGSDTVDYSAILNDDGNITTGGLKITLNDGNNSSLIVDADKDGDFTDTAENIIDTLRDIENVTGTMNNDSIFGDSVANTLKGKDGDDTFFGAGGNDYIFGGDESTDTSLNDTVDYSSVTTKIKANLSTTTKDVMVDNGDSVFNGSDESDLLFGIENITGGSNNDTIIGDANNNTFLGNGGDDIISGGTGEDTIDGGTHTNGIGDTVDYSYVITTTSQILVDLTDSVGTNATVTIGADVSDSDRLIAIENIIGGAGADTFIGTSGINTLQGMSGNDTLKGGAGDDFLDGGADNDTADFSDATGSGVTVDLTKNDGIQSQNVGGGLGTDTLKSIENIIGSSFDDKFYGANDDANIFNGAGQGASGDTVSYEKLTQASDKIVADLINNSVAVTVGGFGKVGDTLVNIENIVGTTGADIFINGAGVNTFTGGDGADTISYAGSGAVTIDLDADSGSVTGSTHTDKIFTIENVVGSSSNDTIKMDEADTINIIDGAGGTSDTISYENYTTTGVKVNLGNTLAQTVSGTTDVDTITNIENLIGTDLGDSLTGNSDGNSITGRSGSDTIFVSGGSDTIDGGVGDIDVANYGSGGAITLTTVVNAGANTYTVVKTNGTDTLTNIEVVQGSEVADSLTGGSVADTFKAGAGNDILIGNGGVDKLYGEAGDDIFKAIDGDTNADYLDGGSDNDTADYSAVSTEVIVTLGADGSTSTVSIDGSANDTITNIENVTGGTDNDTLTGNELANTLIGGAGADILTGGLGADNLVGDAGNDTFIATTGDVVNTIDGGADSDTIDYSAIGSKMIVNLDGANETTVTINALVSDKIKNIENIKGGSVDDTIYGDGGANTIWGNAGDDTIDGEGASSGTDSLIGGAGDDIFIVRAVGATVYDGTDGNVGGTDVDTADFSVIANIAYNNDNTKGKINVDLGLATLQLDGVNISGTFIDIEGAIGGFGDDTIVGTSTANSLVGGAGNDTLIGGGVSGSSDTNYDYIDGGAGNEDFVSYQTSSDIVSIDMSNQTTAQDTGANGYILIIDVENLAGGSNNDFLYGNGSNNTIIGREGSDTLRGGAGDDALVGGIATFTADNITGNTDVAVDTADYSYLTGGTGISVNYNVLGEDDATLNKGFVSEDGEGGRDTLYGIENIIGSKNADSIIGDSDDGIANTFAGREGADIISGGSGADKIYGGYILGEANETGTGTTLNDTLSGGAGNDELYGGKGDDTLKGEAGDDILTGGTGSDTADYSGENKILVTLGEGGTVTVDSDTDGTFENDGSDERDTLFGIENITGSNTGNDTITGDSGVNTIKGMAGDDLLKGGAGADTIDGGNHTVDGSDTQGSTNPYSGKGDTVSYDYLTSTSDKITINLGSQSATETISGTEFIDTILNIENVLGTSGNDDITGNDSNNTLNGGALGADIFKVSGGSDTIDGGVSDGSGNIDQAIYTNANTGIKVTTLAGTTTYNVNKSDTTNDTVIRVEEILGSNYGDSFSGDSLSDTFRGGAGDDEFIGNGGADSLYGDAGADSFKTLIALDGADYYNGGDESDNGRGNDTVDYSAIADGDGSLTTGGIKVTLANNTEALVTVDGGDNDTIVKIENVTGTQNNDSIVGDSGANSLKGEGGNDTLIGGAGADNLFGGTGNDIINGGSDSDNLYGETGDDTFVFGATNSDILGDYIDGGENTAVGDTVDYSGLSFGSGAVGVELTLRGNTVENVKVAGGTIIHSLKNVENVIGTTGKDSIQGDSGNNTLSGGTGNDTLDGNNGDDRLIGGAGNDIFIVRDSGTTTYDGTDDSGVDASDVVDTVNFSYIATFTGDKIYANLQTGSFEKNGTAINATFIDIEGAIGGAGNDIIQGTTTANSLVGGAGNDTLLGGGVTLGVDYIDGGDGNGDFVSFNYTVQDKTIDMSNEASQDTDSRAQNGTVDLIIKDIEHAEGGMGDDYLIGNEKVNTIRGLGGNDTLRGGAGADTLDGGYDRRVAFTISSFSAATTYSFVIAGITFSATGADASAVFSKLASDFRNDTTLNDGINQYSVMTDGNALYLIVKDGDTITPTNLSVSEAVASDWADYSYDAISNGITVDMTLAGAVGTEQVSNDGHGGKDILVDIENIKGSKFKDIIKGDDSKNTILGGVENDTIYGNGGDDILDGESDNDTLFGGDGADTLLGGLGNDKLYGGDEGEWIDSYDDSINGGDGADTIYASFQADGADSGNTLADTIDGGNDVDTIDYSNFTSANTINVTLNTSNYATVTIANGDDDLVANVENIIGTQGNDIITGDSANNTLSGNDGDDILNGGAGDDYLFGESGDDTIKASSGSDIIDGGTTGTNQDWISYNDLSSSGVTVNLATTGAQTVYSNGGNDYVQTISNIENILGTSQNDFITGNSLTNTLVGGAGADTFYGSGGGDEIRGDNLASSLADGLIDEVNYSLSNTSITATILPSGMSVTASEQDRIYDIEKIVGSSNTDRFNLTGTGIIIDGSADFDTVSYDENLTDTKTVVVTLAGSTPATVTLGGVATDKIQNVENFEGAKNNDTITGDSLVNTLSGMAGDDTLDGGANNDKLLGGDGDDTLIGGSGNDVIDGGNHTTASGQGAGTASTGKGDWVDYSSVAGANGVNVNLVSGSGQDMAGSEVGVDTLSNIENVKGSKNGDSLVGNDLTNTLDGGLGDDILAGGLGNDILVGGTGSDTADYTNQKKIKVDLSSGGTATVDTDNDGAFTSGDEQDTISSIENIIGSNTGNDTIFGDAQDNYFRGLGGDDLFKGASASDDISNDTFDGGSGSDTVSYDYITDPTKGIVVDMNSGEITGQGTDKITAIENIIGGDGDDIFKMKEGNFTNSINGDGGINTIDYSSYEDGVMVNLSSTSPQTVVVSSSDIDTITNIQNIIGSDDIDSFIGSSVDNILDGGLGNDTADYSYLDNLSLNGGAGVVVVDLDAGTASVNGDDIDTLIAIENINGGKNNDTFIMKEGATANVIDGNSGIDTVSYEKYNTKVIVNLDAVGGINTVTTSDVDTLVEIENLTGSNVGDELTGSSISNIINGGAGADTIYSSGGSDTLDGGTDSVTDRADYINEGKKIVLSSNASEYSVTKTNYSSDNVDTVQYRGDLGDTLWRYYGRWNC
jgi:Ca2+-binding RTX toxin-like protein